MTGFSVVIPVFNSRDSLVALTSRISDLYGNYDIEIIFIDDGSQDGGKEVLKKLKKEFPKLIKLVFHKENLGEHSAIYSGFKVAEKKWAVTMASDYQNPPEEINKLILTAELENLDVIYGQFIKKEHSFFKNLMSKIINKLATFFLKKPGELYLSNFKCVKNDIYKNIVKKNNPLPIIDIEILKETKNIGKINVIHQKRLFGKSSYNLRRYASFGLRILYNIAPNGLKKLILSFYVYFFPVLIL